MAQQQGRTTLNSSSRQTVKRLDFGVVRKPVRNKAPTSQHPIAMQDPVAVQHSTAVRHSVAEQRPTIPRHSTAPKRPVSPRGRFIDFATSHIQTQTKTQSSVKSPTPALTKIKSPVSTHIPAPIQTKTPTQTLNDDDLSVSVKTKISHETIKISATPTSKRRVIPRGLRMDFLRRPKHRQTTSLPKPEDETSNVPSQDENFDSNLDSDLNLGLDSDSDSNLKSELDAELDSLDELSPDDFAGDDIDAIEAEIAATAAETNDFVKAPKPLFEDPLVKLSKVRERRESVKKSAEAERFREEVIAEAEKQAKKSPYAALYSGDKSPFLDSVNVEKRPLSSPESKSKPTPKLKQKSNKSAFVLRAPGSSRMQHQLNADAREIHRQTMMMSTPETKSHKTALIIAIILTVILGAGVGAVIYLAFFQNK